MNNSFKTIKIVAIASVVFSGVFTSCVSDPNSPGLEYMPDMYRSPAVEAYVDYGHVKERHVDSLVKANPSLVPPHGTVPYSTNLINDMPYAHGAPFGFDKSHGLYGQTFDSTGYVDAATDINPVMYTVDVKKEGKILYGKFCSHCHGEKGDGQGSVVANSNGAYPPPPSYGKQLKDKTAGEIFYSVTYGKGLMGSHASQLSKEERWKVVHYVEVLQGKTKEFDKALLYDAHTDTDGDGVMDNIDECPENKGTIENHGCPEVAADISVLLNRAAKGLTFAVGSDVIGEASFKDLDLVAELLKTNGRKLIINGHTDNTGQAMGNKHLSLKRARAVKKYLSDKGVEVKNISATGYGQVKPIATNSTEEGKLANRRVEFRLL